MANKNENVIYVQAVYDTLCVNCERHIKTGDIVTLTDNNKIVCRYCVED